MCPCLVCKPDFEYFLSFISSLLVDLFYFRLQTSFLLVHFYIFIGFCFLLLRNEDKKYRENKNKTRQMTLTQKYSRPKQPGNSNLVGRKVSWAFRTKNGLMGVKIGKSLEFKI